MYTRILLTLLTFTLIFTSCKKNTSNVEDENQGIISQGIENYTNAFNAHDSDKLADMWMEDGAYVNMTTEETYEGKNAIRDFYKKMFTGDVDKLKTEISTTYSLSTHEAIAKGLATLTNKDGTTKKEAFFAQFIDNNGKWLLQSVSVNELDPPQSHYENLKDLEWLSGDWMDDDDNIDIDYSYEWDKNKNFLTQSFTMTVLDQEVLSGMQIIGWDPIQNAIVSWIFDSDGGFGQGVWNKQDDTWYVTVKFTLPEGGEATSTHVYKKMNDNMYTFASENRVIEGKLLPNIGPYKVIRE